MNTSFFLVVEPQEKLEYQQKWPAAKIIETPFSNLGQGSIPVRNFVWDMALSMGVERYWILDDNMRDFYRLHQNMKYRTTDGASFAAIEDLADRYENVALAGKQYERLTPRRKHFYPLIINTRIYSCILILNSIPYRWRGRYNEDTDLSLRVMKDGWCTLLTCAFLADKEATMTMKGGNTESLYKLDGQDGRLLMAQSLQQQHPDVTKIVRKWGRWQHHVDYRPFKRNKLILRSGVSIPSKPNEYGMVMRKEEPCQP
jgi:hypothetical protein